MTDRPVILFDGVCHLCDRWVRFVLERDRKGLFRFAPLQSTAAKDLLASHGLSEQFPDTVILFENGKCHTRSTAALRILRRLRGGWSLLYGLIIIPPFIRNSVYRWIARNRYRWFGKREECMVPDQKWAERFL
ncbi:MAG: hypothetical protein RJA57_1597 [Bacteroidota bacterium]|jgi:predicted DCC family thiol-disulfide oxidoreductase YuxK